MLKMGWILMVSAVGCGGASFDGSGFSMVPDVAQDGSTEVDTGVATPDAGPRSDVVGGDARADMVNPGDGSGTFEASADGGSVEASISEDGMSDDGSTVPTCGDDEVYPQSSPTCAKWIGTTSHPLEKGCCRRETHTCGHVVTFSPFCVEVR